jgi:hypothetical protein
MQNLINLISSHWLIAYVVGAFAVSLLLARRSQVDAWCEANPRVAGLLKILRGIGLDPWLPIQGLSLLIFGKLPSGYKLLIDTFVKLLAGAVVLLCFGCGTVVAKSPCLGLYCLEVEGLDVPIVGGSPALCWDTREQMLAAKSRLESQGKRVAVRK